MWKKLLTVIRFFSGFHVSTYAASTSFFMILSIFPLLTLVLTLLRYLPLTVDDLLQVLSSLLPAALLELAEALLEDLYRSNVLAVVSISVLVALWSASRGMLGILNGLNAILGAREHRNYLGRRLSAIFYTFLLILALILVLALQVFGRRLTELLRRSGLWDLEALSRLLPLRFVFATAMLTLLFTMVYTCLPARRLALRHTAPPALAMALGAMLFSYLFSVYVDYGGGTRFYGSMAIVALAVLWMYVCISLLFCGGILCRLSAEGRLNRKTAKEFFRR